MILASDFDGTIYVDHKWNPKNLEFIKEFKSKGNKFGIVTGRDMYMTKLVINEYQIPFDFIICNNGTVVYDNEYNVLFKQTLSDDIYQKLLVDETLDESYYRVISTSLGRFIIQGFDVEGTKNQYYTEIISMEEAKELKDVFAVDTKYKNHELVLELTEKIKLDYPTIQLHPNIETIDFAPLNTNKCHALNDVKHYFNDFNVVTIGDGLNDLKMIEEYHGYAMANGLKEVKEKAYKVLENFYDLKEELVRRENEKL
jgi:hypothetical protein